MAGGPIIQGHLGLPTQLPSVSALPLLPHFSPLWHSLSSHALMCDSQCWWEKQSFPLKGCLQWGSVMGRSEGLCKQTAPPGTGPSRDRGWLLPFGSQCWFWSESAEHYTKNFPSHQKLGWAYFLLVTLMLAVSGIAFVSTPYQLWGNTQQFLAFIIQNLSTAKAFCEVLGATVENFLFVVCFLPRATFQLLVSSLSLHPAPSTLLGQ